MNSIIRALCVAVALCGSAAQAQNPHTDPANAGGWVLNPEVSDEFGGGEVDAAKWHVQGTADHYENRFRGRAPSQFVPANVSVSDGHLKITSKWQPTFEFIKEKVQGKSYKDITTGAIISKAMFHYGYMETRCKAAKGPISSSFWTTGEGGEMDVFEHWGKNTKNKDATTRYHSSFHDWRDNKSPTWGKRIWTNAHVLDFEVGDDYHVYGLEWAEDYIRIFVDGGLVRTVTRKEIGDRWVVGNPQKVWLDSELFPWEVKPETLTAADFPGDGLVFSVDYVRIWQRDGKKGEPSETRTNLLKNGSFESGLEHWTADTQAEAAANSGCDGEKAAFIEKRCMLEQEVVLKPDTTYILSGWLSLPGSDHKSTWHHGGFGVRGYGGKEIRVRSTAPDFTRFSLQFTTSSTNESATVFFTNDMKSQPAYGDHFELFEVPGDK